MDGQRVRAAVTDGAVALFTTALVVLGSIGEAYPGANNAVPGMVPPAWPEYLLVGGAGMVLLVRRRWPVGVWAASLAMVLAYTALGNVNGAALLAPVAALYAVTTMSRLRTALICGAVTLVALFTLPFFVGPYHGLGGPQTVIPFEVLAALAVGLAVTNRRKYVAEMRDRAERAERTREEEARRRVDAERLRIARELHDVVAHTMATINVQAAAAAHVLVDPPPEAAAALAAIRSASKDGLRELRAILNVLRASDEPSPTEPTPSLARLDALIEGTRAAGLPTTLSTTGSLPELPGAVDLAAYRIIQESLTNALRYAGPATATVALTVEDGELRIEVTDTGAGVTDTGKGTGHGLVGMRERAAAVGGTVDAGPGRSGGYRVRAVLPVP